MTTLDLSLPADLQTFVESEAADAGFATAAQYVEAVLHEIQKHSQQRNFESQIQEGLDSGPAFEVTPQFWVELKDRLRKQYEVSQT